MKKIPKNLQLNEGLMNALLTKEDKLRSICERLKACGKTHDYTEDKDITFLEIVYYGVFKGVKFSQIAEILGV